MDKIEKKVKLRKDYQISEKSKDFLRKEMASLIFP
jgi:hypothetical protein